MKAFITGASGFVGSAVLQKLLDRGYQVNALARTEQSAGQLEARGAQVVYGDITNPETMVAGMQGCRLVFHLAGLYQVGGIDPRQAERINVEGTRNVLTLAHQLGIRRIVYTSSVAVFGDTRGRIVDETYFSGGPFLTEYDRTKWLAHYEVAEPLISLGAPIVIVQPGIVYGPGDPNFVPGEMMVRFFHGRLPFLPGPETGFTLAHVEDIAEGHLLAAEKGVPGESYVLAGPFVTLGEVVDLWVKVTGRPEPLLRAPARFLRPLAPLSGALERVIALPPLFSQDAIRSLGATYYARADKAAAQLGWKTRPLLEGLSETFEWLAVHDPPLPANIIRNRQRAGLALLSAAGLFLLWLATRRSRPTNRSEA